MTTFSGFPPQSRLVRIPEVFFQEILPHITDIDELRVTLYTLWYLERLEQAVKYLTIGDYLRDRDFILSLGDKPEMHLIAGLEKAISRGTLLTSEPPQIDKPGTTIFANTQRGRTIRNALRDGRLSLDQLAGDATQLDVLRPNIFELYEQNLGPITPMMAEILKDAEAHYPSAWIEEAMELAVQNNSRRWRYVEGILRKWKENGRDGEH